MKIVLRHTVTRRYYQAPGKWVRRADNALAFEDFAAAIEFSRLKRLSRARPVQRLAPYLMPLLHEPPNAWSAWNRGGDDWYSEQISRFLRN
jgi:hypothetical protein